MRRVSIMKRQLYIALSFLVSATLACNVDMGTTPPSPTAVPATVAPIIVTATSPSPTGPTGATAVPAASATPQIATVVVTATRVFITFTPVPPSNTPAPASIFTADKTSLTAGECATLTWDIQGVKALFLDKDPITGTGTKKVCPTISTSYDIAVTNTNGNIDHKVVTITVAQISATPTKTSAPITNTPTAKPLPATVIINNPDCRNVDIQIDRVVILTVLANQTGTFSIAPGTYRWRNCNQGTSVCGADAEFTWLAGSKNEFTLIKTC